MRRINLLTAHGSPTLTRYTGGGCRCVACRAAAAEMRARKASVIRDYRRAYNVEKAAYISAYYREWTAANPDKVRDHWTAQRARRVQADGDHTAAELQAQCARQKGRCFYCKTRLGDSYHDEHVTPIILGGSNGLENIVAACPTCNQRKAAKHPMDFAGILL